MSVVYAPLAIMGGRVEPYVSATEVKFSPTASALDFSDLVPNGNPTVQDRALYELIVRASSKVDAYCMGQYGSLNATLNPDSGRYRMDRKGRFRIHPRLAPIIGVTSFSFGSVMGALNTLAINANNLWVEDQEIVVQAWGGSGTSSISGTNALSWIAGQGNFDGEYYCEWNYINGFQNSFTTTSTAIGATSVVLADATGFLPGLQLTIWDGMNDETVYVASTYDGVSLTVPLSAPLVNAHGIGVNVSAIPATVKQAVIHFICHLVTERGQGGLVIGSDGKITEGGSPGSGLGSHHEVAAYDILDAYRIVSGRT